MTAYQAVLYEKKEDIGTIVLNRPGKMNSFSREMFLELKDILERIAEDHEIRVLVIKGAGKSFSAGGDIKMLNYLNKLPNAGLHKAVGGLVDLAAKLENLEIPTIAAVQGYCLGVGLSLALLCDIRIASQGAVFGTEFTAMGIIPDTGMLYLLPRIVGTAKARELLFTNRRIDAKEAERLGLVNRITDEERLEGEVQTMAGQLAALPPLALRLTKKMLSQSLEMDLATMLQEEALAQTVCLQTDDHREAISAFLERRKPKFSGR